MLGNSRENRTSDHTPFSVSHGADGIHNALPPGSASAVQWRPLARTARHDVALDMDSSQLTPLGRVTVWLRFTPLDEPQRKLAATEYGEKQYRLHLEYYEIDCSEQTDVLELIDIIGPDGKRLARMKGGGPLAVISPDRRSIWQPNGSARRLKMRRSRSMRWKRRTAAMQRRRARTRTPKMSAPALPRRSERRKMNRTAKPPGATWEMPITTATCPSRQSRPMTGHGVQPRCRRAQRPRGHVSPEG